MASEVPIRPLWSWNDFGFPGPEGEVYEALSDDLFGLINSSVQAAANLTYRQA